MTKTRIELKSIKTNAAQSEETNAYTANLYKDGAFIAVVGNDGHGGCDRVLGPGKSKNFAQAHRDYDALDAIVRSDFPPINLAEEGEPESLVENSLESICAELVERHMILQHLRPKLKKSLMIFENGMPGSGENSPVFGYAIKQPQHIGAMKAHILAKHPKAVFLNDMSEDQLITAYRRFA